MGTEQYENKPENWHTSLENFGIHQSPDYMNHVDWGTGTFKKEVTHRPRFGPGGKPEERTSRLTNLQLRQFGDHVTAPDPETGLQQIRETEVPLNSLSYTHQSHVNLDHAKNLSKVDGAELPRVQVQSQPDGRYSVVDGHHRAAAAALRGDETVPVVAYGGWRRRDEGAGGPR